MKNQIQVVSKDHNGLLFVESTTPEDGGGVLFGVKARQDGSPGKRKVKIKADRLSAIRCSLVE